MTTALPEATGPLAGLRVIEAGQLLAGPFAGQLMGDMGADVIKVEPPGVGDPMRQWGREKADGQLPVVAGRRPQQALGDPRTCARRTARSSSLRAGRGVATSSSRTSAPGTLREWGLGYDRLREVNPGMILVRVSGYGQTGPYSSRAGYGSIGEAMGGLRYVLGDPDRQPSRTGISIGDSLAAMHATVGRARGPAAPGPHRARGRSSTAPIYESVLAMMECTGDRVGPVPRYQRERTGADAARTWRPRNVYPTSDGQLILIAANQDSVFARLFAMMGEPELAEPGSRYADHVGRGERPAATSTS